MDGRNSGETFSAASRRGLLSALYSGAGGGCLSAGAGGRDGLGASPYGDDLCALGYHSAGRPTRAVPVRRRAVSVLMMTLSLSIASLASGGLTRPCRDYRRLLMAVY